MEKRFILAIILSFGVLYFWGLVSQKQAPKSVEFSQATAEQSITSEINSSQPEIDDVLSKTVEIESIPEIPSNSYTLESNELKLVFSDLGASLKEITVKDYDSTLPIINMGILKQFSSNSFNLIESGDNKLVFSVLNAGFKIIQSYELNGDGYVLKSSTKIFNDSEMSKLISPKFYGYEINANRMDISSQNMIAQRDKTLNEYAVKYGKKTHRKAKAFSFTEKDAFVEAKNVDWVAFRDRYFVAITKPDFPTKGFQIKPQLDSEYMKEEKGMFGSKLKSTHLSVYYEAEDVTIAPSDYVEYKSITYIGPEEVSKLKPLGLGFENVKRYYRFSLFDLAGKIINQIIHLLYKVIPNWGVCIILLSIIVYFSMYPLTKKSMLSMRKMQAVAPKINEIKAKHKDNPQKLNAAIMEIYKKEKINPAGGCLPMILQMPIFLGLYQVLWRSVGFKGSKFLWIKDLTEPDRLFMLPFSLPVLGNEFNLLPLLMVVIMYFQQKFSTKNMATADPMQAQQQKMMAIMMPFVLGFIFYKFSSGLTLYFTMFYIFSAVTQWKMSKEVKVS